MDVNSLIGYYAAALMGGLTIGLLLVLIDRRRRQKTRLGRMMAVLRRYRSDFRLQPLKGWESVELVDIWCYFRGETQGCPWDRDLGGYQDVLFYIRVNEVCRSVIREGRRWLLYSSHGWRAEVDEDGQVRLRSYDSGWSVTLRHLLPNVGDDRVPFVKEYLEVVGYDHMEQWLMGQHEEAIDWAEAAEPSARPAALERAHRYQHYLNGRGDLEEVISFKTFLAREEDLIAEFGAEFDRVTVGEPDVAPVVG